MKQAVLAFALLLGGCGYHVAGKADLLPKTITTIGVTEFRNPSTRYRLTDWLPEAISREFISRSRYRVVDPDHADAVLRGAVLAYAANAALFDPKTGLASSVEVHVALQVSLVERTTGKVLFTRPRLEYVDNYEIPGQTSQYFDESDTALKRISQRVAQQVVSDILNNF